MSKMPPRKGITKVKLKVSAQPTHRGPLGRAKVLSPEQFDRAAEMAASTSLYGDRDQLFILLSRFCGMRAHEIANLWLEDITDVEGKIMDRINVSKRAAKYGKERTIRMRPEVKNALTNYVEKAEITEGPIFWSYRGTPVTSNIVQKQIKAVYVECGFKGARSHSGRRYAITTMAQKANTVGASLEDVKLFAGHADLSTTSAYIDESPHAESMVGLL